MVGPSPQRWASAGGTGAGANLRLRPSTTSSSKSVRGRVGGGGPESGPGEKSDLQRACVFLLRFATMSPDPMIRSELQAIVANTQHNRAVRSLAAAVKTRIFGNRHASFAATPLLQCVRFMLIKARVPEVILTDRTRLVTDFFFDPAVAKNFDPLPEGGDFVVYKYPAARLRVAIVGGGPTALASAISLAEKGKGKVEVSVYERRWVVETGPHGPRVGYPPTAKRRDQVVTLQDSVTTLMTPASQQMLFAGRPERVWPGSANLQTRKVEDRLLKRCQADEFRGLIHLRAEGGDARRPGQGGRLPRAAGRRRRRVVGAPLLLPRLREGARQELRPAPGLRPPRRPAVVAAAERVPDPGPDALPAQRQRLRRPRLPQHAADGGGVAQDGVSRRPARHVWPAGLPAPAGRVGAGRV